MSAKFTVEGNSAGAVKALMDLDKILDQTAESAEGVTKATKKMATEAQRIKESIDPLSKYDRKMEELATHVKAGTLTMEEARAKAQQYGLALERAGKHSDKTFGGDALKNIGQMALGIMGVSSALDLVVSGFRAVNEEQKKAAENAMRARMGVAQLSQLAASATDENGNITPASQEAAMKSLLAETDKYLAMGAAEDRGAAARLVFDLNSSGLKEADREFAAELRSTGVLQDVAALGQAYDASTTALGVEEVGTFEQFASKAIAAGSVSPGTIQQLPQALTRAGADAKKLGLSDEFLLSAGAYLAKEAGSPEEGATKLGALLAGMNKSGIDLKGLTGTEMIDRLSQENVGYGGIFKDNREAVNAFATVRDNLGAIRALESNVYSAQDQGLAAQSLGLPNVDAATGAANVAAAEEGRYQVEINDLYAERESLSDAIRTAESRADINNGLYWPRRWTNRALNATTDAVGGDDFLISSAQTIEKNAPGTYLPETMKRIEAYLARQEKLLEQQNQVMEDDSMKRRSAMATQTGARQE